MTLTGENSIRWTDGTDISMELLTEIKHIQYTRKNLKYFGYILSGFLILLAFSAFRKYLQIQMYGYFLSSIMFAVATTLNPMLLKPIYKVWMIIALCIGMVVSFVFMTLLFIFAFTTTGLIGKMVGKKFLPLRTDAKVSSYWITKKSDTSNERYEKQY